MERGRRDERERGEKGRGGDEQEGNKEERLGVGEKNVMRRGGKETRDEREDRLGGRLREEGKGDHGGESEARGRTRRERD